LNARIQQLTWSLIFYEKYSTSLSTIVLVVLTTANFGGFSNFCRYYTRSLAGKSTGYRPTLKPLHHTTFCLGSCQVTFHLPLTVQLSCDTLTSNNILFGVMSGNLSFTFDHSIKLWYTYIKQHSVRGHDCSIKCKTVKSIDQSDNSS
jgi:hypothetical protein